MTNWENMTSQDEQRILDNASNLKGLDRSPREAFLDAGWAYSHSIANGEVCSDRTCFRCRLADLLFETEKRTA